MACCRLVEYFSTQSVLVYPDTKYPQCGLDAKLHPSIVNRCQNTLPFLLSLRGISSVSSCP